MRTGRGGGGYLGAVVCGIVAGVCTGTTVALGMAWLTRQSQPDMFDVIGIYSMILYGSMALGGVGAFVGAWLYLRAGGEEEATRPAAAIAAAFLALACLVSSVLLSVAG